MIIPVPVNISLPIAAFIPAIPMCSFDVNITNQSVNASTYNWNFGDNTTSNLANPSHLYQNAGNYTIHLVVSTPAGCIDSTANNVGIAPVPQAIFTPQVDTCSLVAQFFNASQYAVSYYWNFGDSTTSTSANPGTHTYAATGFYNVTLVVEDANGCRDTLTQTINPYIASQADYTFSIDTCSQEVNFLNLSDFAFSYLWDFGDGQTGNGISANHRYSSDGNYPVLLITNPGTMCADTAAYTVNVSLQSIGNIYVPNAFTPNSDGKNDVFEVVGYYPCEDLTLYIFNRWGELIYKKSGQHITWDGNYMGERVNLEVFVYILEGTYFYQNGTITVIR
jgi:gliding motility-associated-like protein